MTMHQDHTCARVNIHQKTFDGTAILASVSFRVARGEIVSIMGPSGVGKTTVLRIVAGLETEYDGDTKVYGPDNALGCAAMLFQDSRLLPWQRVSDNIRFGMKGWPGRRNARTVVHELLETVRLGPEVASLWPSQLSGGMQRRVALARALAAQPDLLLLDEPFSSLDQPTRDDLHVLIDKICRSRDSASPGALIVTHDIAEAVRLCDRILILRNCRPSSLKEELIVESSVRSAVGSPSFNDMCHQVLASLIS